MREHVKHFIRQCPCCQKQSFDRVPIHTHPFTLSRYEPFERLYWDTIGPMPKDEHGNEYVLVFIDAFTRWVELFATKDPSSNSAALALYSLLGRFGAPSQLVNDNGSQFVNQTIKELIKLVGSEHILSLSYSKEENSLVERSNKETNRHVRNLVYDKNNRSEWSLNLPLVQRIINSAPSSVTGYAPAQLLFGNAITLDRGIFVPVDEHKETIELSEWADNRLKAQSSMLALARSNMFINDTANIATRTDRFEPAVIYEPGTYVFALYPNNKPPTKTHSRWRGPFKVVSSSDDEYVLERIHNASSKADVFNVHVSQLKPFVYDPAKTDPSEVALRDDDLMIVQKILSHKGNKNKRDTLRFLIKWSGLDDSHNHWNTYADLRHNSILHDYLRKHKMASLIPRQYKILPHPPAVDDVAP